MDLDITLDNDIKYIITPSRTLWRVKASGRLNLLTRGVLWYIVELKVGGAAICSSTISSSSKPLDVGEISSLSESVIVEDEEDGVGVRVGVRDGVGVGVGVGVTLLPVVVELFSFESVVKDSSKGIDVTSSFSLSSLLSKDVEAFNEMDDEV